MRKIAFANQRGGVGKSTSCINIAAILGSMDYKVLVIDLDPQGNCTQGFGFDENELQENCQPYNDEWCICWHKKIKGSSAKMGIECTVEMLRTKNIVKE